MYNDIELLEQYMRRDCLEIRGIPVLTGEDTSQFVKKVWEIIEVQVQDQDISISHRLADLLDWHNKVCRSQNLHCGKLDTTEQKVV